jgi:hypothetical protein
MPSKRTAVLTRRTARRTFIGAAGVLCLCRAALAEESAAAPALPNLAEPAVLSKFGNANHEIMVRGHTQTDENCVFRQLPDLRLDAPPRHGVLCLRPADDVPIRYLLSGATERGRLCLGKRVSGVRIFYLPHHDYTGADTFRYTALFSKRYRFTRDVNLMILPDVPSPGAVPADLAPAGDTPQAPGPIPPCAALVS